MVVCLPPSGFPSLYLYGEFLRWLLFFPQHVFVFRVGVRSGYGLSLPWKVLLVCGLIFNLLAGAQPSYLRSLSHGLRLSFISFGLSLPQQTLPLCLERTKRCSAIWALAQYLIYTLFNFLLKIGSRALRNGSE